MLNKIPDHLAKHLDIIFVGFNPSLKSGETGHHYANPNNRFWKIIFEAGLTPRKYSPEEDGELIKLGFGLTNIVDRPTKAADEITKEEYQKGRLTLKTKIEYFRPKIACFVGKGVYREYSQKKVIPWGKQEKQIVDGVIDFVAPSSSGLVRMKRQDIIDIYKQLTKMVKK